MKKLLHSVANSYYILYLISYTLYFGFSGCNNSSTEKQPVAQITKEERKVTLVQLLIGDGSNEFRNVNLGIDSKNVLHAEMKIPDENDTGNIYYTFPIDTIHPDSVNEPVDSANYFMLAYNFDKDKLNEIDEDIITPNDSTAGLLMNRLTDYYDNKYGDNTLQNDSKLWSFTKAGKKIWVSLSDKSEEYDYGKISLVIYSEEY